MRNPFFLSAIIVLFTSVAFFHSNGSASDARSLTCPQVFEATPSYQTDPINEMYFHSLLRQNGTLSSVNNIRLYDPDSLTEESNVVYPTATAPVKMLSSVPAVNYGNLKEHASQLESEAQTVTLVINKMQAGTGSSVERKSYMAAENGIDDPKKVRLGAKGTDLKIPSLGITIAEGQIRQAAKSAENDLYHDIVIVDLVSPETSKAVEDGWKNLKTEELKHLRRGNPVFQYNVPTVDSLGRLSTARMAPAGHGLFAFHTLKQVLRNSLKKIKTNRIITLANGEDLSGTPDPLIVGYMKKNNIPILMITTEKTEIDLKGGQIAVAVEPSGIPYVTIVEHAQADSAGQKQLFEQLGLRPNDRKAMFNTNMVLINEDALGPLLKAEVDKIGEEKFFEMIQPSLIKNTKSQIDSDGVERKYVQLEGAMGSLILNLDRYFRTTVGKPVVSFVNVERQYRTQFFAPIKTAFDYYMQFYSDRFFYDKKNHRLIDSRPGFLPAVKFIDKQTKDKYYADVSTILMTFKGAKIRDLDDLTLDGRFQLNGISFSGKVKLVNKTDKVVNLSDYLEKNKLVGITQIDGHWLLKNKEIVIEE